VAACIHQIESASLFVKTTRPIYARKNLMQDTSDKAEELDLIVRRIVSMPLRNKE
jgi:hypothetical protein